MIKINSIITPLRTRATARSRKSDSFKYTKVDKWIYQFVSFLKKNAKLEIIHVENNEAQELLIRPKFRRSKWQ